MVLVAACHLPYDCHYISGNWHMTERMKALRKVLEKIGISPERFRVEYISAAEGLKFAQVITEMAGALKRLGRERILAENEKARPFLERMVGKKVAAIFSGE